MSVSRTSNPSDEYAAPPARAAAIDPVVLEYSRATLPPGDRRSHPAGEDDAESMSVVLRLPDLNRPSSGGDAWHARILGNVTLRGAVTIAVLIVVLIFALSGPRDAPQPIDAPVWKPPGTDTPGENRPLGGAVGMHEPLPTWKGYSPQQFAPAETAQNGAVPGPTFQPAQTQRYGESTPYAESGGTGDASTQARPLQPTTPAGDPAPVPPWTAEQRDASGLDMHQRNVPTQQSGVPPQQPNAPAQQYDVPDTAPQNGAADGATNPAPINPGASNPGVQPSQPAEQVDDSTTGPELRIPEAPFPGKPWSNPYYDAPRSPPGLPPAGDDQQGPDLNRSTHRLPPVNAGAQPQYRTAALPGAAASGPDGTRPPAGVSQPGVASLQGIIIKPELNP